MRGWQTWVVAATLAVAALGVAHPAHAGAVDPARGDEFGRHVVLCVQLMGFEGDHNPGEHAGFSGWDPDHTC